MEGIHPDEFLTCKCGAKITPAEIVAYGERCENCWAENFFVPGRIGTAAPISAKRQKINGIMQSFLPIPMSDLRHSP